MEPGSSLQAPCVLWGLQTEPRAGGAWLCWAAAPSVSGRALLASGGCPLPQGPGHTLGKGTVPWAPICSGVVCPEQSGGRTPPPSHPVPPGPCLVRRRKGHRPSRKPFPWPWGRGAGPSAQGQQRAGRQPRLSSALPSAPGLGQGGCRWLGLFPRGPGQSSSARRVGRVEDTVKTAVPAPGPMLHFSHTFLIKFLKPVLQLKYGSSRGREGAGRSREGQGPPRSPVQDHPPHGTQFRDPGYGATPFPPPHPPPRPWGLGGDR